LPSGSSLFTSIPLWGWAALALGAFFVVKGGR
jgi:hypothetical protein